MASIFTKIINGDIPCFKIYEDDRHLAFLDINPMSKGHTLVIPKLEIDYIFDLPDDVLTDLTLTAKKVSLAIQKAITCERIGLMVIGTEVPHAHIHLIPISKISDMNLSNPKLKLSKEEFEDIAGSIRHFL